MTDETIGGAAASSASHWAAKSGGVASPADGATSGPKPARNARRSASWRASRSAGGSGIQRLSWNGPALAARNDCAQPAISAGDISRQPQAPSPPALATSTDSAGGQAPAIGASRIGARSSWRARKRSMRDRSKDMADYEWMTGADADVMARGWAGWRCAAPRKFFMARRPSCRDWHRRARGD